MRKLLSPVWRWVEERLHVSTVIRATLTEYLVPANLTFWHTLGSVIIACFVIQIVTGMLLLVYYVPDVTKAFDSVQFISSTVPFGWLVRRIHAMTSHLFVLALMLHLVSTLYMRSYRKPRELQWMTGVVLFGLVMGAALSGYLLPWSQLSYWATTVATNSGRSIPVIGDTLVLWLRGTPKISQYTLGRFFAAHVSIIPFTILMVIGIHLLFLRLTGIAARPARRRRGLALTSGGGSDSASVALRAVAAGVSPVGSGSAAVAVSPEAAANTEPQVRKVPFYPHMVTKDICAVFVFLALLNVLIFYWPQLNFPADALVPANSLETPAHIKPHWYFLANYQTLKLVPNEFLGIVIQVLLGVALFFLPFLDRTTPSRPGRPRLFAAAVTLGVLAYIGLLVWGYYS